MWLNYVNEEFFWLSKSDCSPCLKFLRLKPEESEPTRQQVTSKAALLTNQAGSLGGNRAKALTGFEETLAYEVVSASGENCKGPASRASQGLLREPYTCN